MAYTYAQVIAAIRAECATINLSFSKEGDGRLTSAVKEQEYLGALKKGLQASHPLLTFELQPVERWWWDFRVNGIPFNLKLTTGGTDNAFNKVAILFTLTGTEVTRRNMNFNLFFNTLKSLPAKTARDPTTEYHYLVVDKKDGKTLLKSILDIHTYKSNPCNDLQINWAHEFAHAEYSIADGEFRNKGLQILKTLQTSIRQAIASMNEFAEANLNAA